MPSHSMIAIFIESVFVQWVGSSVVARSKNPIFSAVISLILVR